MITPEITAFVELADWAEEARFLPEGRGVNYETESFMSALKAWRGMVHTWKQK